MVLGFGCLSVHAGPPVVPDAVGDDVEGFVVGLEIVQGGGGGGFVPVEGCHEVVFGVGDRFGSGFLCFFLRWVLYQFAVFEGSMKLVETGWLTPYWFSRTAFAPANSLCFISNFSRVSPAKKAFLSSQTIPISLMMAS